MKDLERMVFLVDADNAQPNKIEGILKDVSAYGRIVIKRAYANWSKPHLKPWEAIIKRFAIGAIQQFDFASGKNASDMALTIDAMELLYKGNYDGFVIVSSDSDFTSLAIRLHESGVYVIGYGNRNTVESFRSACDEFNYVEDLADTKKKGKKMAADNSAKKATSSSRQATENARGHSPSAKSSKALEETEDVIGETILTVEELDDLLHIAEEKYAEDDGYVNVSSAGAYIKRVHSDFKITTLGYAKLPEYLRDNNDKYDVTEREGKGTTKLILYKTKKGK